MQEQEDRVIRLPLSAVPGGAGGVRDKQGGVTKALIAAVVDDFYAKCRADPDLGPIFNARIADWDEHLAIIRGFWASVLMRTGEYAGRPLQAHMDIPALEARHFSIWLRLFHDSVTRLCPPDAAEMFMEFAGRMARNMIAQGVGQRAAHT